MSRQAAPNPLLPTRVGSLVPPATQRQRNPRKVHAAVTDLRQFGRAFGAEPVRRDRGALRPLEQKRRRGRRLLRRRGQEGRRLRRRARRRHRADRRADRRDRDTRDRSRLLDGDDRGLPAPSAGCGSQLTPRPAGWATSATPPVDPAEASRPSSARFAPTSTCSDDSRAPKALQSAHRCCSRQAAGSCSTSSSRSPTTSRRPTAAGWSASPGSTSGPTGTSRLAR